MEPQANQSAQPAADVQNTDQNNQQPNQTQNIQPIQPEPKIEPKVIKPNPIVQRFAYNQVWYFRYSPKGIGKLPIFDQFPLAIPLEIKGNTMLALNTHWIPVPLRLKFIQLIINIYETCPNQSVFRIWYQTIKRTPALAFALIGIRKYYLARCANLQSVPPEHWNELHIFWATKFKARYMRRSLRTPNTYH